MLTSRTIFGAAWTVASRLTGRLIDIVTLLVLARILTPADFGLTALAISIIAIVEMVLEIPLIQALTRLREIDKRHLDTAFTLGLIRAVVLTTVVLLAAWPISLIYSEPRLMPLIAALSLAPVSRGMLSPGMAHLIRDIRFREIFITQVIGKVVAAAAALGMLALGVGYWAIVGNHVIAAIVSCLLSYVIAPYAPRLSLSQFRDFSGFAGWFTASQLVSAMNWQMDRILLGGTVNASALGKYTMASDIAVLPTQTLIGPAMQPVMAAFSKINDDPERMKTAFLKAARFTMLLATPACVFAALSSRQLVDVLFDEQWTEVAPYLQVLVLAVLPTAYPPIFHSYAMATNRTRLLAEFNGIDLVLKLLFVPLALFLFSIWGVIAARTLIGFLMFAVCLRYAKHYAGISILSQILNLKEVALATAVLAGITGWMFHAGYLSAFHEVIQLAVIGTLSGLGYLGTLMILGIRLKPLIGIGP